MEESAEEETDTEGEEAETSEDQNEADYTQVCAIFYVKCDACIPCL